MCDRDAQRLSELAFRVMNEDEDMKKKLVEFTVEYLKVPKTNCSEKQCYDQIHSHDYSCSFHLVNPGLAAARSAQLFSAALEDLGYSGVEDLLSHRGHYLIAAHGTNTTAAIRGIMSEGFDTERRSGQMFGKGEYFDVGDGRIAKDYAGFVGDEYLEFVEPYSGTEKTLNLSKHYVGCVKVGFLIGTLIVTRGKNGLHLPEVTYHDYYGRGSAGVVNNPVEGLKAYCLPLGLLPFFSLEKEDDADLVCAVLGFSSDVSERILNETLEAVISQGVGDSEEKRSEVRQYIDEDGVLRLPADFSEWKKVPKAELLQEVPCLGFMNGECQNPSCPRSHKPVLLSIARQQSYGRYNPSRSPAGTFLYKWQYYDDTRGGGDNGYHDYDHSASVILERAYCPTAPSQTCQVHSGSWDYEVDFSASRQKNTTFGTVRKIRRVRTDSTSSIPARPSSSTPARPSYSSSSSPASNDCVIA